MKFLKLSQIYFYFRVCNYSQYLNQCFIKMKQKSISMSVLVFLERNVSFITLVAIAYVLIRNFEWTCVAYGEN